MHFFLYFTRHFDMNENPDDISAACRAAEEALEVLSNLRPGFSRNVVPRLNSTGNQSASSSALPSASHSGWPHVSQPFVPINLLGRVAEDQLSLFIWRKVGPGAPSLPSQLYCASIWEKREPGYDKLPQVTEISACACSAWRDLTRLGEMTRLKPFT